MAAYPRMRTAVIFLICALAIGGVAFYVYGGDSEDISLSSSDTSPLLAAAAQNATGTIASNADWKKQFLGSATSSAFKTTGAKSAAPAKEKPLTATDQLSRDFFTKYAELHQANLTGDAGAVTTVMDQVAVQTATSLPVPKVYSEKDIRVSQSAASIDAYKNEIKSISNDFGAQLDEAAIAADAFETGDMTKLAQIDPIIKQHQSLISRLLAIPVPSSLVKYHVDLLNGMSLVLYSTQAFRHIDTDALRGFAAVRENAVGFQQITTAFSSIQNS